MKVNISVIYLVFLSNTNNLYTVVWFQARLSHFECILYSVGVVCILVISVDVRPYFTGIAL